MSHFSIKKSRYQQWKEEKKFSLWKEYQCLEKNELISLLDHKDTMNRREAATILQLAGGVEIIQLAKSLCSDADYRRRSTGAFILGQINIPTPKEEFEIFHLLHKIALTDKSATVRCNAVASTGHRCKNNAIFASILTKQSAITAYDHSANVRLDTAFVLSCFNNKSMIPVLLKLLKDPDGDVRNWAAFAININEYNSKKIRDHFFNMLSDKHGEARLEAITGLAHRHDKRVAKHLVKELEKECVYDDYITAAGELGDKTLIPVLREMLDRFDDEDGFIQSHLNQLTS